MTIEEDRQQELQIAIWDWEWVDPHRRCWKTSKRSLKACLDILALKKRKEIAAQTSSAREPWGTAYEESSSEVDRAKEALVWGNYSTAMDISMGIVRLG